MLRALPFAIIAVTGLCHLADGFSAPDDVAASTGTVESGPDLSRMVNEPGGG